MFDDEGFEACDYTLAHNIIYGAIDFAEEYGFEPHKDFRITKYILEEDTEDIPLMDIEFGKDGKPLLFDTDAYDEEIDDFDNLPEGSDRDYGPEYPTEEELKPFYDADYYITYEPIKELNRFRSEAEHKEYENIFRGLTNSPSNKELRKYDKQLRKMIEENPANPVPFNCLMNVHKLLNNTEKVKQLIKECYEKYPDYLFGRIEYARLLLSNEDLDKIPEIINNTYLIHELYPEREQFHISEIVNFYAFLCVYCLKTDEYKFANYFYDVISELTDFEEAELLGLKKVVNDTSRHMAFYTMGKAIEKLKSEDGQE